MYRVLFCSYIADNIKKKWHTTEEASTDRQPKKAVFQEGQLLGEPQLSLMSLRGLAKPFRPILKVIKGPLKLELKYSSIGFSQAFGLYSSLLVF